MASERKKLFYIFAPFVLTLALVIPGGIYKNSIYKKASEAIASFDGEKGTSSGDWEITYQKIFDRHFDVHSDPREDLSGKDLSLLVQLGKKNIRYNQTNNTFSFGN